LILVDLFEEGSGVVQFGLTVEAVFSVMSTVNSTVVEV
jgi:hypothetical protein